MKLWTVSPLFLSLLSFLDNMFVCFQFLTNLAINACYFFLLPYKKRHSTKYLFIFLSLNLTWAIGFWASSTFFTWFSLHSFIILFWVLCDIYDLPLLFSNIFFSVQKGLSTLYRSCSSSNKVHSSISYNGNHIIQYLGWGYYFDISKMCLHIFCNNKINFKKFLFHKLGFWFSFSYYIFFKII